MTKRITLCADDYAQSPAISEGIVGLVAAGRLSATSVFAQSPHWREGARQLTPFRERVDIGLHFNLTHPFDSAARPLSHWLLRSQFGALSRGMLVDAFLRQIDAFAEALGQLPDFIDGHQHVHALPVVREALVEAIPRRWTGPARPDVRAPDALGHPGDDRFKAGILRFVCRGFRARLEAAGLKVPPWFGGLYTLRPEADYPGLMQAWLRACPDGGLLMAHPGLPDAGSGDPIGPAREREYCYLAGPEFAEEAARLGAVLARFA